MNSSKIAFKYALISLILLLLFSSCTKHRSSTNERYLITRNSVGPLKLGMTIDKLNDYFSASTIKYDENYGYFVFQNNELILNIWSKDENKTISGIKVFSREYTTAEGVHLGMSAKQLEKIYDYLKYETDFESDEVYCILPDLTQEKEEGYHSVGIACFTADSTNSKNSIKDINCIEIYVWE